jgi:hypothetical protein
MDYLLVLLALSGGCRGRFFFFVGRVAVVAFLPRPIG